MRAVNSRIPLPALAFAVLLSASIATRADIVWQGKRVDAWPEESLRNAPVAGRTMAASTSHYPSPKGKVYGLTLLVDFSDQNAPFTTDEIKDWLNLPGFGRDGCKGSIRDYYLDVSNGQVDFTNDVYGWYRAKHPKSWYEGLSGYSGSDSLLKEVFAWFDGQVDFSRYDNDKDGTTEAISIVYAGPGQTWGQGLWPHSGWAGRTLDGTKVERYQMSDMPGKFSVYVFVHECGHMIFGWPDLYWYGDYCTMGNRADDWNPVAINDFFRADQGWIPFVDVDALDTGSVSSTNGEKAWRYRNPARLDKEGLVWSYQRNVGRRSVLRGSGLLLQHYDFSIGGNGSAAKLGLRIIHADSAGKGDAEQAQWPSPGNDAKALFQSGSWSIFTDQRHPATRWYDGTTTGLVFSEAGVPGTTMGFRLGTPLPAASRNQVLEAESAQIVSGTIRQLAGASRGAYVTGLESAWNRVVFTANLPEAVRCSLIVRYANGGSTTATQTVAIEGADDTIAYHPTGAWARFDSAALVVPMRAGRNRIVFGKGVGAAELDAIRIAPVPGSTGETRPRSIAKRLRREGGFLFLEGFVAGTPWEIARADGTILDRGELAPDGRVRLPAAEGIILLRAGRHGDSFASVLASP